MVRNLLRAAGLSMLLMLAGGSPPARAQDGPAGPLGPGAEAAGRTAEAQAPALAGQDHVTLGQLLVHADQHAPTLLVARARLGLGEAEVSAAAPLLPDNPELEVSAGPRLAPGGQDVDVEVALHQRFEIAGERGLRAQVARRARDRHVAALEQARWQVHQDIRTAFHAALVARERARMAGHLVGFSRRLLEIARKRQAAGADSMLGVKVAEGEAAQALQRQVRADAAYFAIRMTLAEAAGWPHGRPLEPEGDLRPPRLAPAVEGLIGRALAHHPGLQRRQAAIREAEARVALARREVFPRPELGLTYSREAQVGGAPNHLVLGTIGLSIPVWQRNQGERARASARLAVHRAEHAALARALRARVAKAAVAIDAAARRVQAYGAGVLPAFESNLQMIEQAYSAGKVDVLQVMVTRQRFLASQGDALVAYEDYYRAHAELEALLGAEVWPRQADREVSR